MKPARPIRTTSRNAPRFTLPNRRRRGWGSAGRGRRRGEDPLNRGAHRFDDLATVLTRCGAGTYTLELYDEDGGLLREMRV